MESFACRLVYLPRYSPDYPSIELALSSIKTQLRRLAAHTPVALERAVVTARAHVTPEHATPYFADCGFRSWPEDHYFCT